MAYSRASGSGLSEAHFDYVKFGTKTTTSAPYDSGTYTSQSLQLNATSFGSLLWTENKQDWPYPWGQWTKYSGNPVLSPPGIAENVLTMAGSPVPITYGGKYWLAHTSGTGIGLSYSTDPNLHVWTLYASNPILSPGSGETSLSSPCLMMDGSLYYLFFDVWQPGIWERGIYYATASAPTGPWTRGPLILTWGPSGSWDDSRVCSPFLFKDGTTYYLYYMGDKSRTVTNKRLEWLLLRRLIFRWVLEEGTGPSTQAIRFCHSILTQPVGIITWLQMGE